MVVLSSGELQKMAELARLQLKSDDIPRLERELEELFDLFASVRALAGAHSGGEITRTTTTPVPRADEPSLDAGRAERLRSTKGKTDEAGAYVAPPTSFE